MPQLKVKTKYIEKLKRLGIYDKWLSNVKAQYEEWMNNRNADMLYNATDLRDFIDCSFAWKDTPEENDFWWDITNKGHFKFTGVELDAEYYDAVIKRLEMPTHIATK